ncbi:MAG: hypothetical protein ABIQ18_42650 [Umezawaea sp.]
MDVVLELLEPNSAEQAEFEAFYEATSAALPIDRPDEVPVIYNNVVTFPDMAGVNHALGFTTVRSMVEVNRTMAGLLEALGGVDPEQRQPEDEHP